MATLTINTSAAEDARLVVAFGRYMNLQDASGNPRNATAAEIKAFLIQSIIAIVQKTERDAVAQPAPITPT